MPGSALDTLKGFGLGLGVDLMHLHPVGIASWIFKTITDQGQYTWGCHFVRCSRGHCFYRVGTGCLCRRPNPFTGPAARFYLELLLRKCFAGMSPLSCKEACMAFFDGHVGGITAIASRRRGGSALREKCSSTVVARPVVALRKCGGRLPRSPYELLKNSFMAAPFHTSGSALLHQNHEVLRQASKMLINRKPGH